MSESAASSSPRLQFVKIKLCLVHGQHLQGVPSAAVLQSVPSVTHTDCCSEPSDPFPFLGRGLASLTYRPGAILPVLQWEDSVLYSWPPTEKSFSCYNTHLLSFGPSVNVVSLKQALKPAQKQGNAYYGNCSSWISLSALQLRRSS